MRAPRDALLALAGEASTLRSGGPSARTRAEIVSALLVSRFVRAGVRRVGTATVPLREWEAAAATAIDAWRMVGPDGYHGVKLQLGVENFRVL